MAKDKELAFREEAGALAVPDDLIGGTELAERGADPSLPILKLFQGTADEAIEHGNHPPGSFIDTLLKEQVTSPRIAIAGSQRVWTKFEKGRRAPVYVRLSLAAVPPGDLEGDKYSPDKDKKPAAQEGVVALVVVEGTNAAYLMRFKSTSMRVWDKVIDPHERNRGRKRLICGLYQLGSENAEGSGKKYKRMTATPAGDLPESMYSAFRAAKVLWSTAKMRLIGAAEGERDAAEDHEPDHEGSSEIPF